MTSDMDGLSEKEKEVLRLLASGHDAKSVARHLTLSVHTINERLRDARRKLGASSSREAARQLIALERANPEKLGRQFLGDANAAEVDQDPNQPAYSAAAPRARVWIGVLIMSVTLALAAYAMTMPDAPPVTAASTAVTPAAPAPVESDAVRAARAWLALVDAGDWAGSWHATNRTFQSLNTLERWSDVAATVQTPLGAVIRHDLLNELYVPAPPMGYQLVQFRSRYANRPNAVITLTLELEEGRWKVAGITLDEQ